MSPDSGQQDLISPRGAKMDAPYSPRRYAMIMAAKMARKHVPSLAPSLPSLLYSANSENVLGLSPSSYMNT